MPVQHACDICHVGFSRRDALLRHMQAKHGDQTEQATAHRCHTCDKTFSRKEHLQRHQKTCGALKFKCDQCEEEFAEKSQMQDHKRLMHRKRKAPAATKKPGKCAKLVANYYCGVCLASTVTRAELFHHKLSHVKDTSGWESTEPHFDFEDPEINHLLQSNQGIVFAPHRFHDISTSYNFALTLRVGSNHWVPEIGRLLESVVDMNTEEAFKVNFSCGFVLVNRDTGEYRFFAPGMNNAFLKKPIRIDRPSSWRQIYGQLTDSALISYVPQHREDTKWGPVIITNLVVHLYYLGVTMG